MRAFAAQISTAASTHTLPAHLVAAIVQTESGFDPWAFRHEMGYRWLVGDKLTMSVTERIGQQSSWGLMQLMGATARELGFTGPLPQLCDPETNLEYGCRYLARLYARHKDWADAISAYNAGSPRKNADGTYLNQTYVTKVQRAWNKFDTAEQL